MEAIYKFYQPHYDTQHVQYKQLKRPSYYIKTTAGYITFTFKSEYFSVHLLRQILFI